MEPQRNGSGRTQRSLTSLRPRSAVRPLDTDRRREGEAAVARLLEVLGEDPHREGLRETPRRVLDALLELTRGHGADPAGALATVFHQEDHQGMVVLRRVPFASLCEHHLLPFRGHATIAYLPREGVVGLSKVARLLDLLSHRLQVQERLTDQLADALMEHLDARGAAAALEAEHLCMSLRGVRSPASTVTRAFRGELAGEPHRAEFLALAPGHEPAGTPTFP